MSLNSLDSREGSFGFLSSPELGFLGAYTNVCKMDKDMKQEKV